MVGSKGAYNFSHWATPEVDYASSVILTSSSTSARWAASKTILSGIADQVPYIPLFTQPIPFILKNGFVFASAKGIDLFDLANGDRIYQIRQASSEGQSCIMPRPQRHSKAALMVGRASFGVPVSSLGKPGAKARFVFRTSRFAAQRLRPESVALRATDQCC